jgi:hypothetical protein
MLGVCFFVETPSSGPTLRQGLDYAYLRGVLHRDVKPSYRGYSSPPNSPGAVLVLLPFGRPVSVIMNRMSRVTYGLIRYLLDGVHSSQIDRKQVFWWSHQADGSGAAPASRLSSLIYQEVPFGFGFRSLQANLRSGASMVRPGIHNLWHQEIQDIRGRADACGVEAGRREYIRSIGCSHELLWYTGQD